jgi:hypothetical protein
VPPVEVLLEILPAAAVSGGVLLAAWLLPRWRNRAWPAAVAVGAGYATSHALIRGAPEALPADATQLLFHFALAGALLGAVEGKLPVAARWGARAVLAAVVPWLLLRGLEEHTWESTTEAVSWYTGLGLGLFLLWSVLEWRARHLEGPSQPLVFCLVAGGGALALAAGRSGVLGQLSGVLAATLGPLVLLAFLVPKRTARGAIPVFVLLLAALAMSGHFFAELPAASALLLLIAPLAAVRRPWLGAAVAAVLVGAAIYLSYAANPPDPYSGY